MNFKTALIGLLIILLALLVAKYRDRTPEALQTPVPVVDIPSEGRAPVTVPDIAIPPPAGKPDLQAENGPAVKNDSFKQFLLQVEKASGEEEKAALAERYLDEFDRRHAGNRYPALLAVLEEIKNLQGQQRAFAWSILDRLTPIEIAPDLIARYELSNDPIEQKTILDILLSARHNYRDYGIQGDFSAEEYAIDDFMLYVNSSRTEELESDRLIRQFTREGEQDLDAIRNE